MNKIFHICIALFYADFHPRTGKRNGAWMTSFNDQYIKDEELDVILLPTSTPDAFNDEHGNANAYGGPVAVEKTLASIEKDWLFLYVNRVGSEKNLGDGQVCNEDFYPMEPNNPIIPSFMESKTITYSGQSGIIRNLDGTIDIVKKLKSTGEEAVLVTAYIYI